MSTTKSTRPLSKKIGLPIGKDILPGSIHRLKSDLYDIIKTFSILNKMEKIGEIQDDIEDDINTFVDTLFIEANGDRIKDFFENYNLFIDTIRYFGKSCSINTFPSILYTLQKKTQQELEQSIDDRYKSKDTLSNNNGPLNCVEERTRNSLYAFLSGISVLNTQEQENIKKDISDALDNYISNYVHNYDQTKDKEVSLRFDSEKCSITITIKGLIVYGNQSTTDGNDEFIEQLGWIDDEKSELRQTITKIKERGYKIALNYEFRIILPSHGSAMNNEHIWNTSVGKKHNTLSFYTNARVGVKPVSLYYESSYLTQVDPKTIQAILNNDAKHLFIKTTHGDKGIVYSIINKIIQSKKGTMIAEISIQDLAKWYGKTTQTRTINNAKIQQNENTNLGGYRKGNEASPLFDQFLKDIDILIITGINNINTSQYPGTLKLISDGRINNIISIYSEDYDFGRDLPETLRPLFPGNTYTLPALPNNQRAEIFKKVYTDYKDLYKPKLSDNFLHLVASFIPGDAHTYHKIIDQITIQYDTLSNKKETEQLGWILGNNLRSAMEFTEVTSIVENYARSLQTTDQKYISEKSANYIYYLYNAYNIKKILLPILNMYNNEKLLTILTAKYGITKKILMQVG